MIPVWWLKFKAKRSGKADGRKGYPQVDCNTSPIYEQKIKSNYGATIDYLTKEWKEEDVKLKMDYCEGEEEASNIFKRIQEIEPDYKGVREKVEKIEISEGEYKSKGYWVLIVFLALCEFPLNSVIFNIFGEARWLTFIFALGIAVTITVAAHFMGLLLRRGSPFRNLSIAVGCGFLVFVVLGTLLGISWIREKYLLGMGVTELLGVHLDPRMILVVFLAMNLLIFTIATIASFMYHIEASDKAVKEHRKEVTKWRKQIKRKKRLLQEAGAMQKNLAKLKEDLDDLSESLAKIRVHREKLFEIYKEKAEAYAKTCRYLILTYREHNLRARKDPTTPKCFENEPVLDISPFDKSAKDVVDYDCGGEIVFTSKKRVQRESLDVSATSEN